MSDLAHTTDSIAIMTPDITDITNSNASKASNPIGLAESETDENQNSKVVVTSQQIANSVDANANVTRNEDKENSAAASVTDANGNDASAAPETELESSAWSSLRCTAEQTEEIAKREKAKKEREERRKSRGSDYPGLAFGSAMFGSDTTMKFNIIKNELHNIMRSQLRRVEGEVTALGDRIKQLDENLELCERYIKTATQALAEAVQMEMESRKDKGEEEEEENALSQFDAQLKLLEGKLMQARLLAARAANDDGDGEGVPSSRLVNRASSPAGSLQGRVPSQQLYKPLRAPRSLGK